MKTKHLLISILVACALGLACPFSGVVGTGGQVDTLLDDPQAGLDGLDNYHASLTISFTGTQDGQSLERTDTYLQTIWSAQAAQFTTIATTDDSGGSSFLLAGAVGEAQYFQADQNSSCTVSWGPAAGGPSEFRPASLLLTVESAQLVDEQTLDGIATRHYSFDGTALGLPEDATANGEAWIAMDGDFVVKYVLDITGGESMFGDGVQGTQHTEYVLSEVNAQPEVVYPAGCEPVLGETAMPAMDDAASLTRLPGCLDYSTSATPEDVHAFYTDYLTSQGWEERSTLDQGADRILWVFGRPDTNAGILLFMGSGEGVQWVTVMVLNEETAAASQTGTETAPFVPHDPTSRVASAMPILMGSVTAQPPPASFHLEVTHQEPVAGGQSLDTMSADMQGTNVHFTHTNSGRTITGYVIDGQGYDANGQPQAAGSGSASMDWLMWPLDLQMMLATASSGATSAGTETLEGRTVEVYELDASGLTPVGVPPLVTAVTGTLWIDQETGALLKAVLDYQATVGSGSAAGHIEVTVTQIGSVTVSLP